MKIYFVRHGKTKWNKLMKIQGWEDSPLLEDDNSHKIAASKLKGINFDYICSSDLKRAVITKEKILKILEIKDEKNEHKEFREVGFGELEGADISYFKNELKDLWLKYKLYIDDFDPSTVVKGMESVKKVRERGIRKLNELKEKLGDNATILIISHGSFISIMTNIGKTLTSPAIIPDNGEVVLMEF